jgi:hypothetical protein
MPGRQEALQAYDDQAADLVVAGTEDGFTVVFNANFDASHMDECACCRFAWFTRRASYLSNPCERLRDGDGDEDMNAMDVRLHDIAEPLPEGQAASLV